MTAHMATLLARAANGDGAAERQLLEENSGLIYGIVRRFLGRGVEFDDLVQLASLGFIKAVRGFDSTHGTEFSTYAVPKMMGEIRRFFRDDGQIKVGRVVKEQAQRVGRARGEWEEKNGRPPTVSELARATGLTKAELAACESATAPIDSFDRELAGGGHLSDLVGEANMEERTCLYLSLRDAMETLPERERKILQLRYRHDLTQQQTACVIGLSQVQISRLEKRAIERLRELLT